MLLTTVALAVVQLALALHVRNTVIDAAAEGARYAALAGASEADGVARTRELIATAVSADFAADVSASTITVDGVDVVSITVRTDLPLLGLFGPPHGLEVSGHAAVETLD